MPLSNTERAILDKIDTTVHETSKKVSALDERSETQQKQISILFEKTGITTEVLTGVKLRQDMCQENHNPGNQAEQKNNKLVTVGNILMSLAIVVSLVLGIVSLLKS